MLNEEEALPELLALLRQLDPPAAEVILVDGGSTDGTRRVSLLGGERLLRTRRGRAAQLNAGAAAASGKVLIFVHADSRPPRSVVHAARRALRDPHVVLGGFFVRLVAPGGRLLVLPTLHNFLKTYYAPLAFRPAAFASGLRLLFGDQTMFCRAADFRRAGGFDASLPIMEDADLCLRMHAAGKEARPPARRSAGGSAVPWLLPASRRGDAGGRRGTEQHTARVRRGRRLTCGAARRCRCRASLAGGRQRARRAGVLAQQLEQRAPHRSVGFPQVHAHPVARRVQLVQGHAPLRAAQAL